tara:strand:+ start:1340 stop:2242 length:903 start_codon:yes stop_codon:yes gene_type:complete
MDTSKMTIISQHYKTEIIQTINNKYKEDGPKLVGILANNDPASKQYAEWTRKSCTKDNIKYELYETKKGNIYNIIDEVNKDSTIHGVIIYYPVFNDDQDNQLRNSIIPEKDVEGLCETYSYNLYNNIRYTDKYKKHKCILPCTPLAVLKIMEYYNIYNTLSPIGSKLSKKTITIINRSKILGQPLARMLANDGALVYSVDIDSMYKIYKNDTIKINTSTENACLLSDVVILGVPCKEYKLPSSNIRSNTLVINVSSFENIDRNELKYIQGVDFVSRIGKLTIVMLERNLLRLYENYHIRS